MALILEIEESDNDLIFGIPQYLTVSTNKPSNIYYTLDGTPPSSSSLIAVSKIYLPTDINSFTFKCLAYDGQEYSSVFSKNYTVTSSSIKNTRRGNESGIVVMSYDDTSADSFGFDYEGDVAQEMSKVRHSLDFVTSVTNHQGEKVDTTKDFINFITSKVDTSRDGSDSPNNDNVYFDPKSKVVVIDGTTQDKINDQSVRLINRPHGSFDYASKFYTENDSKYTNIISGNLVNYVYNSQTGEVTFYYYESIENRWIISKQKVDPKSFNFSNMPSNSRGGRLVFQWIADPVMSKLR